MAAPVSHGFPPPQPSRGPGSDGTVVGDAGGLSDDVLRREREYHELLAKRTKLFLDPAPARAMALLRAETERATEAEKRYGQAVKDRLALMQRGGTSGSFGGAGMPPVPANSWSAAGQLAAHHAANTRTQAGPSAPPAPPASSASPSPPGAGASFAGRAGGAALSVMSAAGDVARVRADPWLDPATRWQRILDRVPGVSDLREVIADQQVGADVRRAAARQLAVRQFNYQNYDMYLTDEHETRMRHLDRKATVDARYNSPDPKNPLQGVTTWGLSPLPDQRRDSPETERDYHERRASLPHEDAYRQAIGRREAERLRLSGLRNTDAEYEGRQKALRKKIADEQKVVASLEGAGDAESILKKQDSRIKITDWQTGVTKLSEFRLDIGRRIAQTEDDIAAAVRQVDRSRQALGGSTLGNLRQREAVAVEQHERIGGMGPAARIQGQQMLRLLQEAEKSGQDLSMFPAEVFDGASVIAPETVRKMRQRVGGEVIDRDVKAGSLPGGEYRDRISAVRRQVDSVERGVRVDQEASGKLEVDSLLETIEKLFRAINGGNNKFQQLIDDMQRKFEWEMLLLSNKG